MKSNIQGENKQEAMIQEKAVECRRNGQITKAEHCEFHVQSKHLTGKLSRWTPLYR